MYPRTRCRFAAKYAKLAHIGTNAGQVLFSEGGYTYLDVRPALEYEDVGKVKGSVNIPIKTSKKVFDPETRKRIIQKEDNPNFIEQV